MAPTVLCNNYHHTFSTQEPYPRPADGITLSDVEVALQLTTIHEEQAEVNRYNLEIARLQPGDAVVGKLETERDKLLMRISERRNSAPAMRRIPVELWDIIFDHAVASWSNDLQLPSDYSLSVHFDHGPRKLDGSHIASRPGEIRVLAPPLILSQVCSHWRKLAHSMPRLWSSISMDIYGLRADIRPLLKVFFNNSAGHPLSVRIIDSEWQAMDYSSPQLEPTINAGYDPKKAGLDAFLSLMREMHRCAELRLDVDSDVVVGSQPRDQPYPTFPILRSFITTVTAYREPKLQWFWSAVRQAPQLRHAAVDYHDHIPPIPFERLTSLKIHITTSLRPFVALMPTCDSLETLHVQLFRTELLEPAQDQQEAAPPIMVTSLRNLTVLAYNTHDLQLFFSSITLPSLTTLCVSWIKPETMPIRPLSERPWQCIHDTLRRSACSLKCLSLKLSTSIFVDTSQALCRIFEHSLKLTTFTLMLYESYGQPLEDVESRLAEVLSKLSIQNLHSCTSRVLVPELRNFRLFVPQNLAKTRIVENMLSFAESRSKKRLAMLGATAVSPLAELGIWVCRPFWDIKGENEGTLPMLEEKDLLQRVEQLTAGGMTISIDEFQE
uniref:F-box domain-containing protein n=1 Tax=Moniliophthora roreri TaxID=221103 RepID=A0A0W0GB05_MONRR